MWDDFIEGFEMILAARDAQLHDDIVRLPGGGYPHRLTNGGKNLSGGQRLNTADRAENSESLSKNRGQNAFALANTRSAW